LDREVVEDVIIAKEGRIGVCIDLCLEMSSGIQTPASDPSKTDGVTVDTKGLGSIAMGEEGQQQQGVETSDLLGLGVGNLSLDSVDRQRETSAGEPVNLLD